MSDTLSPEYPADVDELDADLHDQEEGDELDDIDEADEQAGAASKATRPSRANTNRLIRRVAAKAAEVAAADRSTLDVASHLLGCENELTDLTASIMTADRSSTQVLTDLDKIANADMFEAAVIAGELGTNRMKRIWALLASMGLAPGSDLPASSAKASITVAKTVHGLDMDGLRKDLEDVVALLKKA